MEHFSPPPERWNRTRVSDCLLPFLRLGDAAAHDATPDELTALRHAALQALRACPDAYRRLLHVYRTADDDTYATWFGGIDCEDALLARAFALIDRALQTTPPSTEVAHAPHDRQAAPHTAEPPPQLGEDAAFRALLRVTPTDAEHDAPAPTVDLFLPLLQLCRAEDDAHRLHAGERCLRSVRAFRADYLHALACYRTHYATAPANAALLPETHRCMALLEQLVARCDSEDALAERKATLEYERGGLGWFSARRKQEIDHELCGIAAEELRLRIADETERLRAALAPLEQQRTTCEQELSLAPVTAFARKRELKDKLRRIDAATEELRRQSELPTLLSRLEALRRQYDKHRPPTDDTLP